MPSKSDSKKARLLRILQERALTYIDEAAFADIATALSPVSTSYLRTLIRATGVALSPSIEGVNQSTFTDLERTLIALSQVYGEADAFHRKSLRDDVIAAKDRSRWGTARLNAGDPRRAVKEEMTLWMLTWLENPLLFPAWVDLRKRAPGGLPSESLPSSR